MSQQVVTIKQYLATRESRKARVIAIENLIDNLLLTMINATDNADINEYRMDDGQMVIRASFNSLESLSAQIRSLEKLKNIYKGELNGRVSVFRSGNCR